MDIKKIEYLASRFRQAIEMALDENLFRELPFLDFPNACCGDASDLLAQYLIDNDLEGNIKCRSVYGTYRYDEFEKIYGHRWLVIDDYYIVDITSDQRQFKDKKIFPQDAVQSCYVGTDSEFHSMFEIEPIQCRNFYDLRCLGEVSYERMKELYDVILECVDR